MLAGFKFNVSHQEIERILSEIEAWWDATYEQVGVEWLPIDGISNFIFNDLGYEDIDEFEDAIQGSFQDFLAAFPHIETRLEGERWQFKMNKPNREPPRKLTLRIESSKQLVETCLLKAEDAEIEIPEIEFTIGQDQRRHIDSLYHHLVVARDNLERHAMELCQDPTDKEKILTIVTKLGQLLDVQEPFELVVHDPLGLCDLKPFTGVRVDQRDPTESDAIAAATATANRTFSAGAAPAA